MKLKFRDLALSRGENRDQCVVLLYREWSSYSVGGKMVLRIMHNLVEREAFSHSARIQGAELKNNFLLKVFMAFCVSLV